MDIQLQKTIIYGFSCYVLFTTENCYVPLGTSPAHMSIISNLIVYYVCLILWYMSATILIIDNHQVTTLNINRR